LILANFLRVFRFERVKLLCSIIAPPPRQKARHAPQIAPAHLPTLETGGAPRPQKRKPETYQEKDPERQKLRGVFFFFIFLGGKKNFIYIYTYTREIKKKKKKKKNGCERDETALFDKNHTEN